jgi:hypothetical protein
VEDNRIIWPETIKARYGKIDDFKKEITIILSNEIKGMEISEEEFCEGINSIIEDVKKEFKDGDEIIYYSERKLLNGKGRESILVARGNVVKEVHALKIT